MTSFYLSAILTTLLPQQGSIRDTGCWAFRLLERQYDYATKVE